MDQARQKPEVARAVNEVRMLDGLREHVGWRQLRKRVDAQKEDFVLSLARRLMSNVEAASLQREIDFKRGYFKGAIDVIERPEKAEENLERAATIAWNLAKEEILKQKEEESPNA